MFVRPTLILVVHKNDLDLMKKTKQDKTPIHPLLHRQSGFSHGQPGLAVVNVVAVRSCRPVDHGRNLIVDQFFFY